MRALRVVLLMLALACGAREPGPGVAAPAGQAPGQTPATPAPDTAAGVERLDGAAECDGLVPERVPSPVAVEWTPPPGTTCAGGTSDGIGSVVVGAVGAAPAAAFRVFGPDGTARGAFEAAPPLAPQPRGWLAITTSGVDVNGYPAVVSHAAVAPDGTLARTEPVSRPASQYVQHRWSLAADPGGGSLVAVTSVTLGGNHWYALDAHRFDAAGAPLASTMTVSFGATQPDVALVGVSSLGDALVAWPGSATLELAWIGREGAVAATGAETLAAVGATPGAGDALTPLLDGGLALRVGGRWIRRYDPPALAGAPPPSWLAARDGWTYRFTRGNAGYALLPPPGRDSPDCSQAIELLAPSGRLCGRVVLHGDGAACSTGAVDQGWDGTVVQQSAAGACTYRFWPRLLAKG